jgi:two-component sensor histidine kinase
MIKGDQWPTLVGRLIDALVWAPLTPAVLLVDRKITSPGRTAVHLALAHLLLSIPFSALHTVIDAVAQYPIAGIAWSPLRQPDFTPYYFLNAWLTYCAFAGLLQAWKFNNQSMSDKLELKQVEKKLVESQLSALRLRLDPHCLFNTLNMISSELGAKPKLARRMIEDLGLLIRQSLEYQESAEISLAEELQLVDHYISIQKTRFGERINFRREVEPAALAARVPSMLLQPLVENAVRHGIEHRVSGGMVGISAHVAAEQLHLEVYDDGIGLPLQWKLDGSTGLGVSVTRERLKTLYSATGNYEFTIGRREGGGTRVSIRIPCTH